ncbi:hypothetical protein Vafri_2434 [Volvox africanus]|nr:hypothetical protein Vafri_2434 [Volvox africanus]
MATCDEIVRLRLKGCGGNREIAWTDEPRASSGVTRYGFCMLMGVWAYGLMGVWAYGRMGLWAYGRMGVWAYGRMGVWAYGRMGVWAYGRMGVWARDCINGGGGPSKGGTGQVKAERVR